MALSQSRIHGIKKVLEITRCMENRPLNLQVKADVVHKIRPGVWYSESPGYIQMFTCMEDFISPIEETVYQNLKTHPIAGSWENKFLAGYKKFHGKNLNIPRWNDIQDNYKKTS